MPKIITDEKLVKEVLERGVENIYPSKESLEKLLLSGKRIRLYCGFDPSAPALHIGNAIAINKLSQFQALGHEVIFLIGDFTGMIGDPTDKTATRRKMTREEVLKNAKDFQKQASVFLDFEGENPALVKYNSEWSDKVTFKDLIEITSHFTVQQMLARDMFRKRMLDYRVNTYCKCPECDHLFPSPAQFGSKKVMQSVQIGKIITICPRCKNNVKFAQKDLIQTEPIYLHEFLYPVAQGYDSVAMDVDLEVGGNDQTFNMLCGRDLMKVELEISGKKYRPKEKSVMTLKLLADNSGKKMGKTEGNAVFLDQEAFKMFENIMNWSDEVIGVAYELCTKVPFSEVEDIQEKLKTGKLKPHEAKIRLAYEFVKLVHGEVRARKARDRYKEISNLISSSSSSSSAGSSSSSSSSFRSSSSPSIDVSPSPEFVEDTKEIIIKEGEKLTKLIVIAGLANSNSEAKRLVEQNAVEIDWKKENNWQRILSREDEGKIIKVGKNDFVKIKFE
jgi:tyrosyl-tRNA synthetase